MPVVIEGALPGGEPFTDFKQFQDTLMAHEEDLARNMVESLLVYALGRDDPLGVDEVVGLFPAAADSEIDRLIAAVADGRAEAIAPLVSRLGAAGIGPVAMVIAAGRHFRQLLGLAAAADGIDAALGAWCAGHEAFELADQLRESGVPAYPVLRATDFHADPQLAARDFFIELDHPLIGPMLYDGAVTLFSDTPARPKHAGAPIGHHTFEVMRDILGYSEEEIGELAAKEVLS